MTILSIEILYHLIVVVFAGAVLGSFSSAITHRTQQGKSWVLSEENKAARSQCPKCQHTLSFKDLIPVVSWVFQKGRCRYCREKISRQYLALELSSIFFALIIYCFFEFSLISFLLLCLLPFVLAQTLLFFRRYIISVQLCGIMGGIILFYLLIIALI